MKIFIYLVVTLGVAIGVTRLAVEDSGYILISRAPYNIELSLTLFLVLAALLFFALYLLLRLLSKLARAPGEVKVWQEKRLSIAAREGTARGYAHLIEGEWERAEKELMGYLGRSPTPLMNYIAAAYAAQRRGELSHRDQYLEQALEAEPEHRTAILLTRARLHYHAGEIEEAITALHALHKERPKNSQVVRLLSELLRSRNEWQELRQLLPAAKKNKVVEGDALLELENDTLEGILLSVDEGQIDSTWHSLKRAQRHRPRVVVAYVKRLINLGRHGQGEKLLRNEIKRKWEASYLELYGRVNSADGLVQLQRAEKWAVDHPNDPDLLLALGRLARKNEVWGEARRFFENAIANGSGEHAYQEYGQLLEELGESEQALAVYRKGLLLAGKSTPAVALDHLKTEPADHP